MVLTATPQLAGTSRGRAIHNDRFHRACLVLSGDYRVLFHIVATNVVPYWNTSNEAVSPPNTYWIKAPGGGGNSSYLMTRVSTKIPGVSLNGTSKGGWGRRQDKLRLIKSRESVVGGWGGVSHVFQ